jgi:histidine ammonia-lyase
LTRVLAIEIYTAARGTEMRAPLLPAPATAAVIATVRSVVPGRGVDRYIAPEIEAVVQLAAVGSLVGAAESVTGPLS